MSYFAKPNFIIYDEWFDDDLKKTGNDFKNKKIKNISNIHEYFYEQSNHHFGASENNLRSDLKVHEKEIITNKLIKNIYEQNDSVSYKQFSFLQKLTKTKLKFSITKKLIYSFSIFSFIFIFGFFMFFTSSSQKSKENITNTFLNIEKEF